MVSRFQTGFRPNLKFDDVRGGRYHSGMITMSSQLHRRFCDNLKSYRNSLGLTQGQMADRLGLKGPNYNRLERGTTCPSLDFIDRVAVALQLDPSELLNGTHAPAAARSTQPAA